MFRKDKVCVGVWMEDDAYLTFLAVVLVVLGIVFIFVIVRVVAVVC